jgi:predicted ATPase
MQRIVLTGGPGAGKTSISRQIVAAHADQFVLVPEAATQVYSRLQTRWDRLDLPGRRDMQRQIYHLQIEQEKFYAIQHPGHTLLLDRGTIDGAAYWPDGPEDYWQTLGTTADAELLRYDLVIWMESSAALGIYDGEQSNTCRFEDAAAAIASGKLLLELWGGHPNLKHVGAFSDLDDKVLAVQELLHVH